MSPYSHEPLFGSHWTRWRHLIILTACLFCIPLFLLGRESETAQGALHFISLGSSSVIGYHNSPTDAVSAPTTPDTDTTRPEGSTDQEKTSTSSEEESASTYPIQASSNDTISDDDYLAICLSVRDQRLDLPEFLIHHYHHLGVRRFYIMDDGSDPPLSTMADFGIPRSRLTFNYQDRATRVNYMQLVFYNQCLEMYGKLHSWIAFLDADEFLEATGNETLREILEGFEKDDTVGALGVNWQMHSSSGLLKRPKSARKSFITCINDDPEQDNRHVKSIVRPSKAVQASNPHKFILQDGAQTVGEHGDVINTIAFRSPITRDRVALHHYAVKSREEFEEKINRSNGMSEAKGDNFWQHVEFEVPHVNCTEMVKYNP